MNNKRIIEAKTHAEFLNKVFNCNYKSWQKSTYNLKKENKVVWMIRIDSLKRDGFRNYILDDKIIECSNKRTRSLKNRLVYQIIEIDKKRYYEYLGEYVLDESTIDKFETVFTKL